MSKFCTYLPNGSYIYVVNDLICVATCNKMYFYTFVWLQAIKCIFIHAIKCIFIHAIKCIFIHAIKCILYICVLRHTCNKL